MMLSYLNNTVGRLDEAFMVDPAYVKLVQTMLQDYVTDCGEQNKPLDYLLFIKTAEKEIKIRYNIILTFNEIVYLVFHVGLKAGREVTREQARKNAEQEIIADLKCNYHKHFRS